MVLKTSEKSSQKKNKRGLWSPEEDQRLKDYVLHHGIGCWSSVPINAGLQRNGKSCRLRWINYLRPGLKRGMFSPQEEELILTLHHTLGNKWSQIAKQLPGRTDNEVKNYWHSYLKKKTVKPGEIIITDEHESKFGNILNKDENHSSLVLMSPSIKASRVENNESVLPRLIFAEWLPDDDNNPEIHQIIGQNSYYSNNMPKQEEDYYFMHGFGYDKLFQEEGGDVVMQQEEMMLKFQDHQQSGFVSDFMDFSAGNNDMVNNNNGFLSLPFSLYKEALF